MRAIRFFGVWIVIAAVLAGAALLMFSGGREWYRWEHPYELDDNDFAKSDVSGYVVGNIKRLVGYRLFDQSPYFAIGMEGSKAYYYLAEINGLDNSMIVIEIPQDKQEDFIKQFSSADLTGEYSYKAELSKNGSGVTSVKTQYDLVKDMCEINSNKSHIIDEYCISLKPIKKPSGIWKFYVGLSLLLIALPYILIMGKVRLKKGAKEYVSIDEYCRRKIAVKVNEIERIENEMIIETELQNEQTINRAYRKQYAGYKETFKISSIFLLAIGLIMLIMRITDNYINVFFIFFTMILFTIAVILIRAGVKLALNQDNRLAMWFGNNTGDIPLQVRIFISDVLITKYENRLEMLRTGENKNI